VAAFGLLFVGAHEIATDYNQTRSVHFASEMSMEMEQTSSRMERDGQPVENPWGSGGMSSATTRQLEWTDKLLEHKDGAPTKVQRKFGEQKQGSTMVFGENERSDERDGALAGVTLELTLGDGGEVEAKAIEGDAPGESLKGHRLTLSLDAFLPEKAVDDGDAWELDAAAVKRGLALDLNPILFPPPTEEPSGDSGRGRRGPRGGSGGMLLMSAEWEGKATLSDSTEEYDGAACQIIKLEIEADGTLEEPSFGGGRGRAFGLEAAAVFETTYEVKLEGRLLYDAIQKLPVRLELEGKAKIESNRSFEREGSTTKMESTQEGTIRLEATASVE
jgi:hypothetical protein